MGRRRIRAACLTLVLATLTCAEGGVGAGEADVLDAKLTLTGDGMFRLDVTVRHGDTGWDHYADAFEALSPGGELLGRRTLLHPHVGEQPFTRSLTGLEIPDGIDEVVVRARDSVDGYGGTEVRVGVPP